MPPRRQQQRSPITRKSIGDRTGTGTGYGVRATGRARFFLYHSAKGELAQETEEPRTGEERRAADRSPPARQTGVRRRRPTERSAAASMGNCLGSDEAAELEVVKNSGQPQGTVISICFSRLIIFC